MLDKPGILLRKVHVFSGGVLSAILGIFAMNATSQDQIPLRSIAIEIDPLRIEEVYDQIRSFSDKNGFAVRIAATRPDGLHFIAQLWREDIKIVVLNPFEPPEIRISFYKNSELAVPESSIDALQNELTDLGQN